MAGAYNALKSTIPGNAFYSSFLKEIKTAYDPSKIQGAQLRLSWIETFAYIAKDGQFGAMMQVSLTNDVRVQS